MSGELRLNDRASVSVGAEYTGLAMDARSKGQTKGLQSDPKAWSAIGASIEFNNGKICGIKTYPVSLGYELGHSRRGWPVIDKSGKILEYFISLSSKLYKTSIQEIESIGIAAI